MNSLWSKVAVFLLLCVPARAADIAISALPAASSVTGADVVPIVQSATTKKATFTVQKNLWDTYYQPLDGDLTALAALSGTHTMYFRSGTSTWSAVTIGSGLLFSGSTLNTGSTITTRLVPRVTTIISSATPTINTDNADAVTITTLATAITSMTTNLSGVPNNFDKLIIRIKDDGSPHAITWGASFASSQSTLPTTTVASKVTTVGLQWDSVKTKWICIAVDQEP